MQRRVCLQSELTESVFQRIRAGKKETRIETHHQQSRVSLAVGELVHAPEYLRSSLSTEFGHVRLRRDIDQPDDRQHDSDQHTSQHAGAQHAQDGRNRNPEIHPRNVAQTAHLFHIHHAKHNGVDDYRRQHRLG